MDLNERDNEKPSSCNQPPSLSPYSDSPQGKQEFIKGVQADKKDTSFSNTLNVLPPEKSDTTPSPSYPKSTGIFSPANVQAANSATSKTDVAKNSASDAKNLTSGDTTAKIEATQHTTPSVQIPQLLPVPPTSKLTTIPVSKDDSSKQRMPTELRPKNITDTEGSSMSISDCVPPSPSATTGKPRSVAEATKDAIESTKTPSRPYPKSPNEIISATENALKNQK
ncbi:unnamed protein product [Angiostrongylus costaricensis]|uniref:PAM2 domain-containing protein n=1 Tax=Angiostrongylus costaricensis TaxID=334426 RepID=A0A0R3PX50_ANGCS|nr:unnamed protein product [Angiostrongylus costaricensis]